MVSVPLMTIVSVAIFFVALLMLIVAILLLRANRSAPLDESSAADSYPPTEASPSGTYSSQFSPDGRIRLDIEPVEWAPHHWCNTPRIVDVARDRTLLDLRGSDWDATPSFPRDGCLWLILRRYRAPGLMWLEVDLADDWYRASERPSGREVPWEGPVTGDLTEQVDALFREVSSMMPTAPARPIRQHPFAAWRTALVILVGALATIALLVWLFPKGPGIRVPLVHVPSGRP